MAARSYGQYCGVTTAVELIGERWALLIVRDLLVGPRRYTDLKQGLPRIPTNILSTRLKELQEGGVVRRVPMRGCGLVYELTRVRAGARADRARARALGVPGHGRSGRGRRRHARLAHHGAAHVVPSRGAQDLDVELHVGEVALRVIVRGGTLTVAQLAPPAPPVGGVLPPGEPEAVIVAGPGIRRLIGGEVTPAEAIAQDLVAVVRGDERILDAFARTFHIAPLPGLAPRTPDATRGARRPAPADRPTHMTCLNTKE